MLVQGIAAVDDRDLDANRERYWRESVEKLPATKDMHPPKPLRGMLNWYYTRLYVKVRPERVFVWPDGDHSKPAELHRLPPRGGPLGPHRGAARARTPRRWADREAGTSGSASSGSATRPPCSPGSRLTGSLYPPACRSCPSRRCGRIALGHGPAGLPLTEGRACLTAHSHAPDFTWQENFQVRGDLVREGDDWALVPHKLVGGFELPDESQFATMRRNFAKGRRFYKTAKKALRSGVSLDRPVPASPPLNATVVRTPGARRRVRRKRLQPACQGPAG